MPTSKQRRKNNTVTTPDTAELLAIALAALNHAPRFRLPAGRMFRDSYELAYAIERRLGRVPRYFMAADADQFPDGTIYVRLRDLSWNRWEARTYTVKAWASMDVDEAACEQLVREGRWREVHVGEVHLAMRKAAIAHNKRTGEWPPPINEPD